MGGKYRAVLRLQGQEGESIVETLVAILIAALSCTILMTSVTAAVSINKNASEAQAEFERELLEAEKREGTEEALISIGVVLNSDKASQVSSGSSDILITGGEGKLTSYRVAPVEESRQ